jgi:UDP-glucose:glycoprotein glucosyltransferase
MTSEQTLDTAVKLINEHQFLPELSTFNLALALHTAVPRIEAAYSWYGSNVDEGGLGVQGCGSWVEWQGKGYCESEGLSIALDEGQRDM